MSESARSSPVDPVSSAPLDTTVNEDVINDDAMLS